MGPARPAPDGATRRRPRARVGVAVGALAVVVVAGAASAARPPKPPPPVAVTLAGHVEGMYPGGQTVLAVSVTNPHRFAIRVETLTVTASAASPDCPADAITFGPPVTGGTVPARAAADVAVPASMATSAPEACKGARWPLTYSVTASRVR